MAWAESGLLGKKVNDLEIKLVEREAIASDLRSQLTELRSEREREFEELRNQTVQLRESLARAKREVNERAAAIADQFSKAQQDTLTHRDVKGRPAAEQAMQMRLTLAEEAVADARRVVQKALTVARSPVVVPSEPRLGYRQAMRRVFRRSLLDVPERIKGYEGTHARKN